MDILGWLKSSSLLFESIALSFNQKSFFFLENLFPFIKSSHSKSVKKFLTHKRDPKKKK